MKSANEGEIEMNNKILKSQNYQQNNATYAKNKRLYHDLFCLGKPLLTRLIRFLTNACVDTMVDYFKGNIDRSLDEVGEVMIDFLKKMKK